MKLSRFILAKVGVLLLLFASPGLAATIPNMVGTWTSTISQAMEYQDVLNPAGPTDPANPPISQTNVSGSMVVTNQNGRSFAGYLSPSAGIKFFMTGAIAKDNSFIIQTYGDNSRNFFSGQLVITTTTKGKVMTLMGLSHSYEEILPTVIPSIASGYFEAKKAK